MVRFFECNKTELSSTQCNAGPNFNDIWKWKVVRSFIELIFTYSRQMKNWREWIIKLHNKSFLSLSLSFSISYSLSLSLSLSLTHTHSCKSNYTYFLSLSLSNMPNRPLTATCLPTFTCSDWCICPKFAHALSLSLSLVFESTLIFYHRLSHSRVEEILSSAPFSR